MARLEGTRLGDYELVERIGGGGMAEVYRARQLRAFGREVAVKIILPGFSEREEFRARFLREAQVISRLSHPNILPLIDFGEQETTLYLVMPLVREGTLRDRLRARQGPMPLSEAIPLFTQICSAVEFAHSQGIIHRDIKPQNVLLQQGTHVLLADFGIARASAETGVTATGASIGTAEYMAPEQAIGQADARSDIYSLGVVLYQMLTGAVPFAGTTPVQVMMRHTNEAVPDPRMLNPSLPVRLVQALQTALAKAPSARFQNALSLSRAVQEAAGDAPPQPEQRASGWQPGALPQPGLLPPGWPADTPSLPGQRPSGLQTNIQPPTAQRPSGWLSGPGAAPPAQEGRPSVPMPGLPAQAGNPPAPMPGVFPSGSLQSYAPPPAGPGQPGFPPSERFAQFGSSGALYPPPAGAPSQPGFGAPGMPPASGAFYSNYGALPDLTNTPTQVRPGMPPPAPGYGTPGAPGLPGAPVPSKRRNGPLIAILSLLALIVLLGGGVLVVFLGKGSTSGQGNTPTPAPTATSLPTATPTPSAPPGFQVFTNSTMTFSIIYPTDWTHTNSPAGTGNGGEFQGTNGQIFIVTDIGAGAGAGDLAALDDAFCEGSNGNGGFGGKPTAPKQVMIAGQSWTQEECTNTSNGLHAAVETVLYKEHVYLIAYASTIGTFANNRSQYFMPMEQSFKFLT